MQGVNFAAVYHLPWLEYRHALADGRVCLRVRTARADWASVKAVFSYSYGGPAGASESQSASMQVAWRDETHDMYEVILAPEDPRLAYHFLLERDGLVVMLDQDGVHMPTDIGAEGVNNFHFSHAYPSEAKPEWARGAVGYQIFPDRFKREGKWLEGLEPWGSAHVENEYRFGGNLAGITKSVPYLKELGVGIVYMTPLFVSDTSHRYNTFDYFKIDPLLGTNDELRVLADTLHEAGIRIVLDGVFNHSGTAFAPFQDALKNGESSPYRDWFFFTDQYECGYRTFSLEPYMPKLNLQTPAAQQYFMEVGRYWLRECHVDGWRLDVSPEVYPDFWRQYRRAVKQENPDAILIAEAWDDSREWLTVGDMFDGTMHYVLSGAIWRFFAEKSCTLAKFDACINRAMAMYPHAVQEVLWNFLSSHDTPRMITRAGGDKQNFRSAAFFQMTHPGVPIIYYGDELGMAGGADPQCRGSMVWDQVQGNETLAYYKRLTQMRMGSDALRFGTLRTFAVHEDGLYAYLRGHEGESALCVLNTGDANVAKLLALPADLAQSENLIDRMTGEVHGVYRGMVDISLKAGEGMVLEINR